MVIFAKRAIFYQMDKKSQTFATWLVLFTLIGLLGYGLFLVHWLLFGILFCIYLLYVLSIFKVKKRKNE